MGNLKSLFGCLLGISDSSWSWFLLSPSLTFLSSYPSQGMAMPCLNEKSKKHLRLLLISCATQEQILIDLSSKYIQNLTTSHHLHWCHYVLATIISHLGLFCGPQQLPLLSLLFHTTCSQTLCEDLQWLSSHWCWPTSHPRPRCQSVPPLPLRSVLLRPALLTLLCFTGFLAAPWRSQVNSDLKSTTIALSA